MGRPRAGKVRSSWPAQPAQLPPAPEASDAQLLHCAVEGALVSIDADGAVRAVVGGADYQQSQYNRAVTSRRQPGSTFKPFVYMAAMEAGYTPDTIAQDAPININGWQPENADGKYMGEITLRQGLAYSRNTISAQLA